MIHGKVRPMKQKRSAGLMESAPAKRGYCGGVENVVVATLFSFFINLDVKTEQNHIPVFYYIIFSFQANQAFFLGSRVASRI